MKISIVTATYNSAKSVAHALSSVSSQTWPDIEHIVIDGASQDDTLAIVERMGTRVAKIVSESDRGIYDALNKGIALASGDVVGFLHSDDEFAHTDVVSWVAGEFSDPSVHAVYGDLHYITGDGSQVVRDWKAGPFSPAKLARGWMPPHPSLYLRRTVYEELGGFDETLRIAADYEFILRLFRRGDCVSRYVPRTFVRMRLGGTSNRSLTNILRKSREDLIAMRRHNLGPSTLVLKNLRKLPQFRARHA